MRWLDEQYLATPFVARPGEGRGLTADGGGAAPGQVNRKRGATADEADALEALGPKPNTSRPSAQHRIYPYLLRGLAIGRTKRGLPTSPTSGWPAVAAICKPRGKQRRHEISFLIISRTP
jgi:putative transposase